MKLGDFAQNVFVTNNGQLELMLKSFQLCVTIYFFETKGCNLLGTLNATLYVLSFPGMQS